MLSFTNVFLFWDLIMLRKQAGGDSEFNPFFPTVILI